MLDMTHPFDDHDEDSSVTTVERADVERALRVNVSPTPSRVDDSRRLAVERARYFRRKYALERSLATVLFVAVSPLIALLVVLVRLTSKGPGIYSQQRVGLHGELFDVYKLRSMYSNAESGGRPVWCKKGDKRITPLGKLLRKTHLDELPQLWNVVKGEMSLTGPRPERPEICEELATFIDDYYRRTVIKPGVTGLAQINLEPDQTRGDVRRKQFLDVHYIQTANLWLDVRMLAATCLRVCFIRGSRAMKLMSLCRLDLVQQNVLPEEGDDLLLFPPSTDSESKTAPTKSVNLPTGASINRPR